MMVFSVLLFRARCANVSYCFVQLSNYGTKLIDIGKFEEPKANGVYATGQLFLHKIFSYRGVILFPWIAEVFDRDDPNGQGTGQYYDGMKKPPIYGNKELRSTAHPYYQVLIDARDCPHVRAQTESVTFLGNQDRNSSHKSLYAIPGLDYVAHEDMLPYKTSEPNPIHHELVDQFLFRQPSEDPPFAARDTLKAWQKRNHPWLELSDVHKETTENIRVTAIPFFMGFRSKQSVPVYWFAECLSVAGRKLSSSNMQQLNNSINRTNIAACRHLYLPGDHCRLLAEMKQWRYCIRLENLGDASVQLRERHWRIFSLSGTLETVRGRGVVGQEPILSKRFPAFQYSSHVSLPATSGHMWGTYRMEREDGYIFDCRIPPFSLESGAKFDPEPPTGN